MVKKIIYILVFICIQLAFVSSFAVKDEYELYIGVAKRNLASAENHRTLAQNNLISANSDAAQADCKKSIEYIQEAQKSLDRFYSLPSSISSLPMQEKESFKSDYQKQYKNLVDSHKSAKDSILKSCERTLASEKNGNTESQTPNGIQ